MITKYNIEYAAPFRRGAQTAHYQTDDPITAEQFLVELLERGFKIREIKHDGVVLSQKDFNKMIKTAANILVAQHLCASLDLKPEEERFRFGFAA
jgi:hypothetical protein